MAGRKGSLSQWCTHQFVAARDRLAPLLAPRKADRSGCDIAAMGYRERLGHPGLG